LEETDIEKDVAPSWVRRIEEALEEARKHRDQDPGKPDAEAKQRHEHGEEGEQ
jgi:hypothetical protein